MCALHHPHHHQLRSIGLKDLTDTVEEMDGSENGEEAAHSTDITKVNSTKLPLSASSDGDDSLDNVMAADPGKSSIIS